MIDSKGLVAIGKLHKTHALKGEMNAVLDIDEEYIEEGNPVILDIDGIYVPFYISEIRPKGSTSFLVKLDGIDSEEDARGFVNKTLYAEKKELAKFLDMEEDEIHANADLENYVIFDNFAQKEIGRVLRIEDSTANLLFIVETVNGEEVYIPVAEEWITEINDKDRIIRMDIPDGLIDLNNKKDSL